MEIYYSGQGGYKISPHQIKKILKKMKKSFKKINKIRKLSEKEEQLSSKEAEKLLENI